MPDTEPIDPTKERLMNENQAPYPGCNGHRIKAKCALAGGKAHPGRPAKVVAK